MKAYYDKGKRRAFRPFAVGRQARFFASGGLEQMRVKKEEEEGRRQKDLFGGSPPPQTNKGTHRSGFWKGDA